MRVTHLTPSGELGGAERVILECIRAGDGWPDTHSSVVTLGSGPFLPAAERLGADTQVVKAPEGVAAAGDAFATSGAVVRALLPAVWRFPGFFKRFSRAVAGFLPELIHSHGIKTHVLAALLPHRAPVVWHLHDYIGMRPVSSRLLTLLSRRCALAIAVSESVAEDARRCLPAGLPVLVVYNPVDGDRFCPEGPALDLDALSGLPAPAAGTIRIGLPATYARWKGHDIFLAAIARLNRPDIRAYVIGGPVYETRNSQWSQRELDALAAKLGLEARIGFTGIVDDMPAAYRALDIVVHAASRPEPFGLVLAEAMACGRALVAAPAGGAGELFVQGQHALGVEAGNVEALAAVLDGLADDPEKRRVIGRRARRHALESFGPNRFAADLRAALSRVLDLSVERSTGPLTHV